MYAKTYILTCLAVLMLLISSSTATAQNGMSFGVAQPLPIDGSASNGTIVSKNNQAYSPSSSAYDTAIIGVITVRPAVEIPPKELPPGFSPVITSGIAQVRVNGQNGPINPGDPITSSDTQGVGMKATSTGFILGISQEGATFNQTEETLIEVLISPRILYTKPTSTPYVTRLRDNLSLSAIAAIEEPHVAFRYTVAGLVVLAALIFSFFSFTHLAKDSISAIGRNPLAQNMIKSGIVLNFIISLAMIVASLVAAFLIITY
jgi:hypothetical protein